MRDEDLRKISPAVFRYIGTVEELPQEAENGEVVIKDNKIHVYWKGWEEVPELKFDILDSIRHAVDNAEDSDLKRRITDILNYYDKYSVYYS